MTASSARRPRAPIDLSGQRFGHWLVLERAEQHPLWLCRCVCGVERLVHRGNLRNGRSKGCGCRSPNKLINLTNMRFANWTVLERAGQDQWGKTLWLCRCDCGAERTVYGQLLRSGNSQSCGCLRREIALQINFKHGHARRGQTSRAYRCWANMHQRCNNPRNPGYHNYGGRGLQVHPRYGSFPNFLSDGGEPKPGESLDRTDNGKGYEPGNLRWTSRLEQARNRRPAKRKRRRADVKDIIAYADALARAAKREKEKSNVSLLKGEQQ